MFLNALLCGFEAQYSAECRGVCLLPAAPVNVRDWDSLTFFLGGRGVKGGLRTQSILKKHIYLIIKN